MRKDGGEKRESGENPARDRSEPDRGRKLARLPDLYWYGGLCVLFLFSLYLRVVIPFKNVFLADGVRFSSESDAWYHMMLAKTTFLHLERPWFDPLTNFPNGAGLHFGPFVSWGIALISKVLALGGSSLQVVDTVGAFWPAILGALLVIPVYLIGKEVGGRGCGMTAAFLAVILPGQLFSRTVLGFTDHHSSEVLLSTTAILLFMMAFRIGQNLTFSSLAQMDMARIKRPLAVAVASGVMLGLYIDAWAMGILFQGILMIFILLQTAAEYVRGRDAEYPGIIGGIGFLVALLMVLPFADARNGFAVIYYSLFQPVMLLAGGIFVLAVAFLARFLRQRGQSWPVLAGAVPGAVILVALVAYVVMPGFIGSLVGSMRTYLFPRSGGAATVAELSPIYERTYGQLTGIDANFPGVSHYLSPFYFSIAGMVLVAYRSVKETNPAHLLFLVWSIVIFLITLSANRSAYYYGVNVALLCAYLAAEAYRQIDFSSIEGYLAGLVKGKTPEMPGVISMGSALLIFLVILFLAMPSLQDSIQTATYSRGPNTDWYSSIKWLGNNTPDPGLPIYEVYQRPPSGQKFQYLATAYGVMSWWDYGHLIETIGGRYPNANPFQQGIGNKTAGIPGSSPFFLAESEAEAETVLAGLNTSRSPYFNTRYVMTDVEMAVTKFHAMAAWSAINTGRYYGYVFQAQGESSLVPIQIWLEPYFRTMVARLHFFDGSEIPLGEAVGIAVEKVQTNDGSQVMLVTQAPLISTNRTELEEFVNKSQEAGYNASIVSRSFAISPIHVEALQHYRLVHESPTAATSDGQKYVKTFEHVPGATIRGTAAPGSKVMIAVAVMTNQNRSFIYVQSNVTDSQGQYTLVVPYSTEGPLPDGTRFDTAPAGPYQLSAGGSIYEVKVPEELVQSGGVIEV